MGTRFILCLFASLFVLNVYAQKTYVVSVGIADYKEINDLRLSENDARAFSALMEMQGATVVTLLGKEATHAKIISALRLAFASAKLEDTMIFYFSGHGYEGGFCCWDMANANSPLHSTMDNQTKLSKANRYYGGLSYAEMQILFRNCRAGKKLVYADACFSGGLRKGNQINVSVQSARNGNVAYFLSSHTNETSLEMANGNYGLFTHYLLSGLSGEADGNRDRFITIREIYDYVYTNVVAYANRIPHSQHPVMWGRFDENMKIFNLNN